MDRLVLLLALWEARLGAARPRFPQGNRCRQGVWHRASAGALDASGRLFCVCFVARRRNQTIDDVRAAARQFCERYNTEWLIEKNGLRSPRHARLAWEQACFQQAA